MEISIIILFLAGVALVTLASAATYCIWKDKITNSLHIRTLMWAKCSLLVAGLCGAMFIQLPATVHVVTESGDGHPQVEHKQILFGYKYDKGGKIMQEKVSMSAQYIHNATNANLVLYSVGYGIDRTNSAQVIRIPAQSLMRCNDSPSYYFEEAPSVIFKRKDDSSTRWVLDYETTAEEHIQVDEAARYVERERITDILLDY